MSPILKNSVHEMSPFESVHEKSPTLKNSVHEMSLSTKCLHPIFENNFIDFREAASLEKIFEIVQENTLKCSKLIHFWATKN